MAKTILCNYPPSKQPWKRPWPLPERGMLLEPENQMVRAALAQVHFFRSERDLFLSEAEIALGLNPNAPALIGFLGWLLALYGEWEQGLAILEKGIPSNPHYRGGSIWRRIFIFSSGAVGGSLSGSPGHPDHPTLLGSAFKGLGAGPLGKRQEGSPGGGGVAPFSAGFPHPGPISNRLFCQIPLSY